MSTDKIRDEFEAWWADPAQAELRKSCSNGLAHHVWQASRAALCVELPKECPTNQSHAEDRAEAFGINDGIRYCREAIEAAGVRVKE